MGVIDAPNRVVPPGPEQDLLLRAATEEIQERGFIVSSVNLVIWLTLGFAWWKWLGFW